MFDIESLHMLEADINVITSKDFDNDSRESKE